jgi:threonine/homoserine/homoserine lactone efflux protein
MTSLGLLLAPLALFMFVSSITPGPNNLMLLSSGIRFGFGRTVPHLLGITAGMVLLLLVAYAGVGALLLAAPRIGGLLSLLCCGYLLWLATLLLCEAEAPAPGARQQPPRRPLRLYEAVLFQFVNPKAWAMAVAASAIAGKLPLELPARLGLMLLISAAVNLPCVSLWALFGQGMRRALETPGLRRAFNLAMAALVVATALWMLLPLFDGAAAPAALDAAREPAYLLGR